MALSQRSVGGAHSDPVAHLARLIAMSGNARPRFGIAMAWAYFDETVVNNDTMIVGGCVADQAAWEQFTAEWKTALADESVSEFHATDFHTSNGEFAWKTAAGKPAVRRHANFDKRLARMITEHVQGAFAFAAPVTPIKGQTAEHAAYRLALDDAFRDMLRGWFWGSFRIEYFVVARRSGVAPLTVLENFSTHKLLDHMSGCGVFPPSVVLPLQAADYILHAVNRKERLWEDNPSLEFLRAGFKKRKKPFLTKVAPSEHASSVWPRPRKGRRA